MYLRDTVTENDLLDDVEYDDAEILFAVVQPVREWNEAPPPVAFFNCATFPYKHHWMKAITAELMRTAANHYLRNKMQSNQAGLALNDRDKNREYLELSQLYRQEWKDFVTREKIRINANLAMGTVLSDYSRGWW